MAGAHAAARSHRAKPSRSARSPLLAAGVVALVLAVTLGVLLTRSGRSEADPQPVPAGAAVATNPFAGTKIYGDPALPAATAAKLLVAAKSPTAADIQKIAATPQPIWIGDWVNTSAVRTTVGTQVAAARAQGRLPFYVSYAIPHRDCGGGYSAGGLKDGAAYRGWVGQLADGLRGGRSVVVLEPDALAQVTCLPANQQAERYTLLSGAIRTLGAAGATVYLDGGHSGWVGAGEMAGRLRRAGVANARGFALNVSNFGTTRDQLTYGNAMVRDLGGRPRFVVDTSRNGNGPPPGRTWCNPAGRALGTTRPPPPATRSPTRCCGSSTPASRTGPATTGPRPAGGSSRTPPPSPRADPPDPLPAASASFTTDVARPGGDLSFVRNRGCHVAGAHSSARSHRQVPSRHAARRHARPVRVRRSRSPLLLATAVVAVLLAVTIGTLLPRNVSPSTVPTAAHPVTALTSAPPVTPSAPPTTVSPRPVRRTAAPVRPTPVVVPTRAPEPAAPPVTSAGNPFAAAPLYGDPSMPAVAAARSLLSAHASTASAVARIANTPQPIWIGDWLSPGAVRGAVAGQVAAARGAGKLPFYVAYAIPHRDCGGYSSGGLTAGTYRDWIGQVAAGLAGGRSAVVLEPDALAQVTCLPAAQQTERYGLLADAVRTLGAAGATVYLDAGNAGWIGAADMAGRLRKAGVASARGFALNVSNFGTTASELGYGDAVVAALGGTGRFVVDTSRNGNGPAPETSGATRPAGPSAPPRPPPPATPSPTRCCGSSTPASRTAPATTARRRARGSRRTRRRSPGSVRPCGVGDADARGGACPQHGIAR